MRESKSASAFYLNYYVIIRFILLILFTLPHGITFLVCSSSNRISIIGMDLTLKIRQWYTISTQFLWKPSKRELGIRIGGNFAIQGLGTTVIAKSNVCGNFTNRNFIQYIGSYILCAVLKTLFTAWWYQTSTIKINIMTYLTIIKYFVIGHRLMRLIS